MKGKILFKVKIILIVFFMTILLAENLQNSFILAESAEVDGQQVKLGIKATPKIDIALAKARTTTDIAPFENKIKAKLKELNIDTSDTNVETLKAEEVETLETFSWQKDESETIGKITITGSGNNVEMIGNKTKPGKNAMWIMPTKNEEQKFTFGYDIDFGDSFNAAGMLLRVKQSGNNLTGYMLSFITTDPDGSAWRNAAGNKNGALWKFTYDLNNNTKNITKEIIQGIDIAVKGDLTVSATDTQIKIKGTGMDSEYVYKIPTEDANIVGNGYGFFSDHFSHSCENIGSFKLKF